MENETGKVWLVGAGPGAAGLLTISGWQLLDEADVVVHDALVSDELLCSLPACKLVSAGKRAGNHAMPQSQINAILIEEARKGRRVVRLKGGDPFVFGRGGEELLALKDAGIPFEVVPGVTSAFAAAAYAGIPVTHRGTSSLVHVITWHGEASAPQHETLEALAQSGGTLVILMGARFAADIGAALISAGYKRSTPAVIIESATTVRQRESAATLNELAFSGLYENVAPPAVIVVGAVCGLRETLAWAQSRPLFGLRAVVTRPQPKCDALCEKIRALGGEAIPFPCIETVPAQVASDQLACARDYAWIVFTSAVGVNVFFEACLNAGLDSRRLAGSRVAAIGPVTAEALRRYGLIADYVPKTYDAISLGRELAERMGGSEKALLIRAEEGSDSLSAALAAGGAAYDELPVYRTQYRTHGRAADIIREGRFDHVVFSSASTVRGFARCLPDIDFAHVYAVCIGEPTARAAEALGMRTKVALRATSDGLCEALAGLNAGRTEHGI